MPAASPHSPASAPGAPAPEAALELALAEPSLHETLRALARVVAEAGASAWLVGGAVRDLALGLTPLRDIDLAVSGDALELGRRVADALGWSYVPLDAERGTARVVAPGGAYVDVTALASDGLDADLRRRDLTVNAIALELAAAAETPPRLVLADPCRGLPDLAERTVRLTHEAALAEDPVRLLRVFRIAAARDLRIHPDTLAAVRRDAPLAARPAAERTTAELFALLGEEHAAHWVRTVDEAGVLGALLPESAPLRSLVQGPHHHLVAWAHTLAALDELDGLLGDLEGLAPAAAPLLREHLGARLAGDRTRVALLRLALLAHDLGKPAAHRERDGRPTFYGHDGVGAELAATVGARMRLSTAERDALQLLVREHMLPLSLESTGGFSAKRARRFFGRFGDEGMTLLLLSAADALATRGPARPADAAHATIAFTREMLEAYATTHRTELATPPLVSGEDLMRHAGFSAGPDLGLALREIRERQLEGVLLTRADALAFARAMRERRGPEA